MIRCDACGASNPDGAAWCGQCLASLTAPGVPDPTPTDADTSTSPAAAATPRAAPPAQTSRGFRRREDGEVEWECTACGEFNPIGADACILCGTAFTARWVAPEPPAPPDAVSGALLVSALLPGTGHIRLGRTPSGVVRMLLFVMWLIGAIVVVGAGGPVVLTAGPLIVGVIAVWALSLVDITRLRDGQPQLLTGRAVVWFVSGVIGAEVLALLAASLTLR